MEKRDVESVFRKLRAESAYDVIEGLDEIERKIKGLREKDFNEAILALCSLFYIDLFDRPDLEPAVDRAFKILAATKEKSIPLILHQLKEADLKVQMQLARALGQIGKPAIKPLLKFYSGSFDPTRRIFALYAMGKIREPEMAKIIPKVIEAMDDSNAEVRDTATRLLGKLVEHLEPKSISQKVRKKMFSSLIKNLSDSHSAVRAKAVRSMGKMGKFGFIGLKEKSVAKKAVRKILGLDEAFDWDRAYIVRAEAEEAMNYLD
ncbi:MAG: HEAT repeat domain-containing protein [Thermodesulfobacteriota bacterium]